MFIITSMPVGGAETLLVNLMRRMDRRVVRPELTCLKEPGPLAEQIQNFQEIYTIGKYASRFIKATKSALSVRGICSDKLAEPFNHFLPPERKRVEAILDRMVAALNEIL